MHKNQINELIELLVLLNTASEIEEPEVLKEVLNDGKNSLIANESRKKEDKFNLMMRGY